MENKQKDLTTTITVKVSTRKRLNMWKYNLDCKTVDEVIDKILKIIPASELESFKYNGKTPKQLLKEPKQLGDIQ